MLYYPCANDNDSLTEMLDVMEWASNYIILINIGVIIYLYLDDAGLADLF